jgi:prepilin-type N-terminal cleavage/methylation domain-containing protein
MPFVVKRKTTVKQAYHLYCRSSIKDGYEDNKFIADAGVETEGLPCRAAFTLIELLVVIAIIAILAAIEVGSGTGLTPKGAVDNTTLFM